MSVFDKENVSPAVGKRIRSSIQLRRVDAKRKRVSWAAERALCSPESSMEFTQVCPVGHMDSSMDLTQVVRQPVASLSASRDTSLDLTQVVRQPVADLFSDASAMEFTEVVRQPVVCSRDSSMDLTQVVRQPVASLSADASAMEFTEVVRQPVVCSRDSMDLTQVVRQPFSLCAAACASPSEISMGFSRAIARLSSILDSSTMELTEVLRPPLGKQGATEDMEFCTPLKGVSAHAVELEEKCRADRNAAAAREQQASAQLLLRPSISPGEPSLSVPVPLDASLLDASLLVPVPLDASLPVPVPSPAPACVPAPAGPSVGVVDTNELSLLATGGGGGGEDSLNLTGPSVGVVDTNELSLLAPGGGGGGEDSLNLTVELESRARRQRVSAFYEPDMRSLMRTYLQRPPSPPPPVGLSFAEFCTLGGVSYFFEEVTATLNMEREKGRLSLSAPGVSQLELDWTESVVAGLQHFAATTREAVDALEEAFERQNPDVAVQLRRAVGPHAEALMNDIRTLKYSSQLEAQAKWWYPRIFTELSSHRANLSVALDAAAAEQRDCRARLAQLSASLDQTIALRAANTQSQFEAAETLDVLEGLSGLAIRAHVSSPSNTSNLSVSLLHTFSIDFALDGAGTILSSHFNHPYPPGSFGARLVDTAEVPLLLQMARRKDDLTELLQAVSFRLGRVRDLLAEVELLLQRLPVELCFDDDSYPQHATASLVLIDAARCRKASVTFFLSFGYPHEELKFSVRQCLGHTSPSVVEQIVSSVPRGYARLTATMDALMTAFLN